MAARAPLELIDNFEGDASCITNGFDRRALARVMFYTSESLEILDPKNQQEFLALFSQLIKFCGEFPVERINFNVGDRSGGGKNITYVHGLLSDPEKYGNLLQEHGSVEAAEWFREENPKLSADRCKKALRYTKHDLRDIEVWNGRIPARAFRGQHRWKDIGLNEEEFVFAEDGRVWVKHADRTYTHENLYNHLCKLFKLAELFDMAKFSDYKLIMDPNQDGDSPIYLLIEPTPYCKIYPATGQERKAWIQRRKKEMMETFERKSQEFLKLCNENPRGRAICSGTAIRRADLVGIRFAAKLDDSEWFQKDTAKPLSELASATDEPSPDFASQWQGEYTVAQLGIPQTYEFEPVPGEENVIKCISEEAGTHEIYIQNFRSCMRFSEIESKHSADEVHTEVYSGEIANGKIRWVNLSSLNVKEPEWRSNRPQQFDLSSTNTFASTSTHAIPISRSDHMSQRQSERDISLYDAQKARKYPEQRITDSSGTTRFHLDGMNYIEHKQKNGKRTGVTVYSGELPDLQYGTVVFWKKGFAGFVMCESDNTEYQFARRSVVDSDIDLITRGCRVRFRIGVSRGRKKEAQQISIA